MYKIKRDNEKGTFKNDWLYARYAFSFGEYYNPDWTGFEDLLVLNHDIIQPNSGFEMHSHQDMEIITYVLRGELKHMDNKGNSESINPHSIQRMTAGRGIKHSEKNPSPDKETELFQIWILPEEKNLDPGYEMKEITDAEKTNQLRLIVSNDGREGSLKAHQDVSFYASLLDKDFSIDYTIKKGKSLFIQMASGCLEVNNDLELKAGDAVAITHKEAMGLQLKSKDAETHFVLIELKNRD